MICSFAAKVKLKTSTKSGWGAWAYYLFILSFLFFIIIKICKVWGLVGSLEHPSLDWTHPSKAPGPLGSAAMFSP